MVMKLIGNYIDEMKMSLIATKMIVFCLKFSLQLKNLTSPLQWFMCHPICITWYLNYSR